MKIKNGKVSQTIMLFYPEIQIYGDSKNDIKKEYIRNETVY